VIPSRIAHDGEGGEVRHERDTQSEAAELLVTELRKSFDAGPVLRGVSLHITRGQFLTLLGPSGCGKTTLLTLVAGFIEPDSGEIAIRGHSVSGVPAHHRNLGMVFQNYALFPHMTVRDNIAFGLKMRRIGRKDISRRVGRALELVRLPNLEHRYPKQLSGGQQQRVALARALVLEPAVLLLDEPLSNLDAKLRQEMRVEISEIQKETSVTTVFVTHDQEEALVMSDQIAVMNEGVLEQIGSPVAIYEQPASSFVAEFVGESNAFRGVVESQRGGMAHIRTQQGDLVRAQVDGDWQKGEKVLAFVRPEKVLLRPETPNDASEDVNAIFGPLERVLYFGASMRGHVRHGSARIIVSVPNSGVLNGIAVGARVWATWNDKDVIVVRDRN
jgi:spermidine/putrescine ABC transporter ATP-binding subunit